MSNMRETQKSQVVTPADIERRLINLSKEIDEAHSELVEVESHYNSVKSQYEIALAKTRMSYSTISSPTGKNYTVQEREDMTLIENQDAHLKMGSAETLVKAARANVNRIRTQVDIARSIGSSVRASLEV